MAYAAVVSLAQTIDQIVNDGQYPIFLPRNQEIISIRDHAIFLQAFLKNFHEKAMSLEGRIREVASKAEDTIEYFMLEKIPSHSGSIKSAVGLSKVKFKCQLRKVAEKMKSIVGEAKSSVTSKDARLISDSRAASSSPKFPPPRKDMIGRDGDYIEIVDWLTREDYTLRFLSIVGMGGIGKTTLTRNIYDELIGYFDICAWVTVSQDYSAEEILSGLLVSMGVPTEKISGHRRELIREVYKILNGRRYLIVLDNVWSTKFWDDVKLAFLDDKVGSRIVLTTRDSNVASYIDSFCSLYEMRLMDADQSWILLRWEVFRYEACPVELQDIGESIARSCGGLPLSIVTIAELLSRISKTRATWEAIAENVSSLLVTNDGRFETTVISSYTQLPHHLRPCLLYMVGFPQDYEIRVSKLINLWIAEGFVESTGFNTLEEVAEGYLEELVDRSLVLVTGRKSDGKIRSCSLHDVVQDFCIRRVQEEKFFLPVMDYLPDTSLRRYFLPQILKNQRRISVTSYDLDLKETISKSPIRTIICTPHIGYRSMGFVQNFRLLRVLHVVQKNDYWDWEPGQVFELIHLRYLASNIAFIPAAISKLKNLQTLIIYRHDVLLPVEIWRLPQLKYLIAFSFHQLPYPKGATFRLEKLQMLSLVTNFVCSERILKIIPNLKKLGICYCGDKFDEDCHLYNLRYLHKLENLKLEVRRDFLFRKNLNPVFPVALRKLTLSGLQLPWEDVMIVGSLPHLEVLKLKDLAFEGFEWETISGEFDCLKVLLIDQLDLHRWVTDSSHFPKLQFLLLHRCPYLREIPSEIGDIPTLQVIELDDQNESLMESAKRIEEELWRWGNIGFQVHVKHF